MDIYYLPEEFRGDESPPRRIEEVKKRVLSEIKIFLSTLKFGWAIRIHTNKGMFSGRLGKIRLGDKYLHWKFLGGVAKKIPTSIALEKVVGFIILDKQRWRRKR